jgi:hypothetical protein
MKYKTWNVKESIKIYSKANESKEKAQNLCSKMRGFLSMKTWGLCTEKCLYIGYIR